MKIKRVLSGFLLAGMLISCVAQASLVDRGGGLIYDNALNVTWLQEARYAYTSGFSPNGKMTWQAAMSWAANLAYLDSVRGVEYSDWRLPNVGEIQYLFSTNLGGSFHSNIYGPHNGNFDLFRNIQTSDSYWTSTDTTQQPELYAVDFSFGDGWQSTHIKDVSYYAWAVPDGDVAMVPEPGSIALMGLALGSLAGYRRKRVTS